jgi:hypothetical protein
VWHTLTAICVVAEEQLMSSDRLSEQRGWRRLGMVVFLMLAAAAGIAGLLVNWSTANSFTGGRDMAEDALQRFAPVRRYLLQRGVRQAGYTRGERTVDISQGGPFFRAQYALIPVVIWPDANREYVIGDSAAPDVPAQLNLAPVVDFGNGLVLLRHR